VILEVRRLGWIVALRHWKGDGGVVVGLDEGVDRGARSCSTAVKLAPARALRARIENQLST
jgi:hypothetical protein